LAKAHTRRGLSLSQNEAKNPKDRFPLSSQRGATGFLEMLAKMELIMNESNAVSTPTQNTPAVEQRQQPKAPAQNPAAATSSPANQGSPVPSKAARRQMRKQH